MPSTRDVNHSDYASQIVSALPQGVLLTTKAGEKVNCMTIAWGTLGTNWGRPVFVSYVRTSRFTARMLEQNPEFTINVPLCDDFDKRILGICGRNHGNEVDKVALAGLDLVDSRLVSVPGVAQLPLTLECKVIYQQLEDPSLYPADIAEHYYPQDVASTECGSNRDPHYMVYGQIVNAYVIEG